MKKIVLFVVCILYSVLYLYAEEPNLKKIADDMKFNNGVRFIELESYDKAVEVLQEYLEIYHDGIHRDEAYRHIAEIYFKQLDYQKAIIYYRALYEEYSDSDQGAEAYYRTGLCYVKMGDLVQAKTIFEFLVKEHPGSQFAHQAKHQLDLMEIIK